MRSFIREQQRMHITDAPDSAALILKVPAGVPGDKPASGNIRDVSDPKGRFIEYLEVPPTSRHTFTGANSGGRAS